MVFNNAEFEIQENGAEDIIEVEAQDAVAVDEVEENYVIDVIAAQEEEENIVVELERETINKDYEESDKQNSVTEPEVSTQPGKTEVP